VIAIPDYDDAMLRKACVVPMPTKLPARVVEKYWEYKRLFDRMNTRLGPAEFARIGIECGYGEEQPVDNRKPSFAQLVKEKKVKSQAEVVVEWQNEPTRGKFVRLAADGRVVVRLGNDPQEQTVSQECVTLPKAA
jgi:hypothetical protein